MFRTSTDETPLMNKAVTLKHLVPFVVVTPEPEFLKVLDVVQLSWVTLLQYCMEVGDSVSGLSDQGSYLLFQKGEWRVCSNFRGMLQASWESLSESGGEERLPVS